MMTEAANGTNKTHKIVKDVKKDPNNNTTRKKVRFYLLDDRFLPFLPDPSSRAKVAKWRMKDRVKCLNLWGAQE